MQAPVKNSMRVGQYTVRELSMRENLDAQREHPAPGIERAAGYLGRAVSNGDDCPIGEAAVLELSGAWFNALLDAFNNVSRRAIDGTPLPDTPLSEETSAEGNL